MYFEQIKLKCTNIEPYCDEAVSGAKQMCLLASTVVCVEGKGEREVCSGGGNRLSVYERDTTRNKTQQIL